MYWKWKSMIIDFSKLPNDKVKGSDYITKKDVVFKYLGVPDEREHEWQNGYYSYEYNEALKYAFELDLIAIIEGEFEILIN